MLINFFAIICIYQRFGSISLVFLLWPYSVNLDLLLCTGFDSEHVVMFLCHIFNQRPMTDKKIEPSYWRGFGRQQLLANSIENFISHEKKSDSSRPEIYKALEPC